MQVYSQRIAAFISEITLAIKNILINEVRVKVHGNRFYDRTGLHSFPIKVVIFNHNQKLGYFDSEFFEMGFHERLIHCDKKVLHNIIRHELAHYQTFILYRNGVCPHGIEFQSVCQRIGWGEEVSRATTSSSDLAESSNNSDHTILRKVEKLMALANSNNQHEAEQALIKSQQLLLKHNVTLEQLPDGDKVFIKRVLKEKRTSSKMQAIASILDTFFVHVIYNRSDEYTYLEILGSAVNVEIAEYVATTLYKQFDSLWDQAKGQLRYSHATVAKNSFFHGLAKGYCNKVQAFKREYSSDISHALMVIEKQLANAANLVYQNLTTSKSHRNYCPTSAALGEQMGRQLSINPAVKSDQQHSPKYLA
jgi:hypothetical protein